MLKFLVPEGGFGYISLQKTFLKEGNMAVRRSVLPGNVDEIKKKLESMLGSLVNFLKGFLPLFGRSDTQENAGYFLKGLLSDLPRKTAEPIAEFWNLERKTMQRFVGAGPWKDVPIKEAMVRDIAQSLGAPDGVLSVDPSAFPKQGKFSVGTARQWCGTKGKTDNCQVGVFLSYGSSKGHTLVDDRLYLPEDWARNRRRRKKANVPKDLVFKKKWELADEMLQQRAAAFPHAWITSDCESGRCREWRDRLNSRGERYVLDVPCDTNFHYSVKGVCMGGTWTATEWAANLQPNQWTRFEVRLTENGVKYVDAAMEQVFTDGEDQTLRRELLVAIRTVEDKPETKFVLSNAPSNTPLSSIVKAADRHWLIEDCFKRAKGEVGLDQYEVRSWVGWHHHMTLAMLALWFLEKERGRKSSALFPPHGPNSRLHHWGVNPEQGVGLEETRKKGLEADDKKYTSPKRSLEECSTLRWGNTTAETLVIMVSQDVVQ